MLFITFFFTMVAPLYSSSISFNEIKPYYDDGDFINLRKLLHQKRDNILSGKISPDTEYELLYIQVLEAKSLFCLGMLDSVALKMDAIEQKFQHLLFHKLNNDKIENCELDQCICNKYNFASYESMDAWYNRDKLFASIWVVVKKKRGESNEEYYQIPEPTVVKYNGEDDVLYMIKGPQQSINSKPKPNFEEDDDIIQYDGAISQFNRIEYIRKEFKNMVTGHKRMNRLEFNELYVDEDSGPTWSFQISYLPVLKDKWYKLYIMDEGKKTISRNSFRLKRTQRDHQNKYKLFIRWNQDWTLHEAINDNEILIEFPEDYITNPDSLVFSINGENIILADSLEGNNIAFSGTEEREYAKWRLPDDKYGEFINKEKEIMETRRYNINLDAYESENIEIRFHDGYLNYAKEIKEINKSKRFSIIAISLSILLILFLQ